MSEKLTLSVDEAAAKLGVDRKGVYDEIKAGRFPHIRVGRRILVPKAAFDRWLECPSDEAA